MNRNQTSVPRTKATLESSLNSRAAADMKTRIYRIIIMLLLGDKPEFYASKTRLLVLVWEPHFSNGFLFSHEKLVHFPKLLLTITTYHAKRPPPSREQCVTELSFSIQFSPINAGYPSQCNYGHFQILVLP